MRSNPGAARSMSKTPSPISIPRRRAAGRIGNAAVAARERADPAHFLRLQGKVENSKVLRDPLRVRRAWDREHVLLDRPAERDLRDRLASRARNLGDHRI